MSIEETKSRYLGLMHAMQTGVEFQRDKSDQSPKHLRVGVNSALVSNCALADLLIRKGIITEQELQESVCDMMQREVDAYRNRIAAELGVPVETINLA